MKINLTLFGTLLLIFFTVDCNSQDKGIQIDYDKVKVIESVYVIDHNGIDIKQQPDVNSKTLGKYNYGEQLDIIEINKGWLGVRDRITREYEEDGHKIESTGWEKVYVQENQTGKLSNIQLTQQDLNVIISLTKNGKTEHFVNGDSLTNYLKFELIDRIAFLSKKSTSVNFLLSDTTPNRKKNGKIELFCEKKNKLYIDKPNEEVEAQKYSYIGQIEFLNKYVVKGSYYESSDYKLIDKTSGEETQTLAEYPYISTDKKHIICIYANPYEPAGDVELYVIKDKQTILVISASFKNWMPAIEKEDIFWSTDGYLYVPALHVKAFWNEQGGIDDNYQYIRIKPL